MILLLFTIMTDSNRSPPFSTDERAMLAATLGRKRTLSAPLAGNRSTAQYAVGTGRGKTLLLHLVLTVLAAQTAAATATSQTYVPEITTGDALRAEIHAVDAELFRLMWKDCEPPEKWAAFLHPDGEFYHDVNGYRNFSSASIRFIQRRCEGQAQSGERTRRELVEGSLLVDPVPRFGAIATGEHRFYHTPEGQPEQLIDTARFLILYKREPDGWKVYHVFSYAHLPANSGR